MHATGRHGEEQFRRLALQRQEAGRVGKDGPGLTGRAGRDGFALDNLRPDAQLGEV